MGSNGKFSWPNVHTYKAQYEIVNSDSLIENHNEKINKKWPKIISMTHKFGHFLLIKMMLMIILVMEILLKLKLKTVGNLILI